MNDLSYYDKYKNYKELYLGLKSKQLYGGNDEQNQQIPQNSIEDNKISTKEALEKQLNYTLDEMIKYIKIFFERVRCCQKDILTLHLNVTKLVNKIQYFKNDNDKKNEKIQQYTMVILDAISTFNINIAKHESLNKLNDFNTSLEKAIYVAEITIELFHEYIVFVNNILTNSNCYLPIETNTISICKESNIGYDCYRMIATQGLLRLSMLYDTITGTIEKKVKENSEANEFVKLHSDKMNKISSTIKGYAKQVNLLVGNIQDKQIC
jgi:hypothetical protein